MYKQDKMDGTLKPFSYQTFKQFDGPAREALKTYFESNGKKVVDNPWTEHEADLWSPEAQCFIECEVLRTWKSGEYPTYYAHRLFERKRFYLDNERKANVIYYVLSADLTKAWWVDGSQLKEENLRDVSLKNYTPGDDKPKEKMFYFSKDVVHHINLV